MNNPLVSLIVITYNSSNYIIETLESIKNQTYPNLELIITDDCSTDMTIPTIFSWLGTNKKFKKYTRVIKSNKNTGTPENCNRGLEIASGKWVKMLSGDDTLEADCIEKFINYTNHKRCDIVFSKVNIINGNRKRKHFSNNRFFDYNSKKQLKKILSNDCNLFAPAAFIRNDLILRLGGFDTKYKIIEDLPFWIKLGLNNIVFNLVDEYLVNYRINESNISISNSTRYIDTKFYNEYKLIFKELIVNELRKRKMYVSIFNYKKYFFFTDLIIQLGNKNSETTNLLRLLSTKITLNNFRKGINLIIEKRNNN